MGQPSAGRVKDATGWQIRTTEFIDPRKTDLSNWAERVRVVQTTMQHFPAQEASVDTQNRPLVDTSKPTIN